MCSKINVQNEKVTYLEITGCHNLTEFESLPPNLKYLYIRGAYNLQYIPKIPETLEVLEICGVGTHFTLPLFPEELRQVWLINLPNLRKLPELSEYLMQINISDCPKLEKGIIQRPHIAYSHENARLIRRYQSKVRQQKRFKIIKEDLIKAQFHPDRVQRWVEAGFEDW